MDTDNGTCFPIQVVVFMFLNFSSWIKIDSKSINAQTWKRFVHSCTSYKKNPSCQKSFSGSIYVPRIDIFYLFAACSWMSLQVECSVEESVTIRASKRLKDSINVANITYMVIVSQQSGRNFVFLQTSSSEFSDKGSIYKIYVVKQNVEYREIIKKRNIDQVDSLELIGTGSVHCKNDWRENFDFFLSVVDFSANGDQ